jgi:four helix bundle protein
VTDSRARTKALALRIVRLSSASPKSAKAQVLGKQVRRSGTSVGAHDREAHRTRSSAEFVSKLECGLQELDETCYWLELLTESDIVPPERLADLIDEANQLIAILVTCVKNAKRSKEEG